MAGFYSHGPTLTYVTDPELNVQDQKRVLREFVRCGGSQMLRVAFRLPGASDAEIAFLFDWYLEMVREEGMVDELLPPLIHNRQHLVGEQRESHSWLPASRLAQDSCANVYSVHSLDEAQRAIALGAKEVIFGHIFETGSHSGIPGRGVDALAEVATAIRTEINTPVVTAIGGIDEHSVAEVGRARIFSVAAIRAISKSPKIDATLGCMRHQWLSALIEEDLDDPGPLAFGRQWSIGHRWAADSRMSAEKPERY